MRALFALGTVYMLSVNFLKMTLIRCYYCITISQIRKLRHETFKYCAQDNRFAQLTQGKPKALSAASMPPMTISG